MLHKRHLHRLWQYRIVRFGFVGTVNTLTDFALLNIFVLGFGAALLVGNTLSASISIFLSYFWNSKFVFQQQQSRSLTMFVKFVLVTALSILLVQNSIIYMIEHLISLGAIARAFGVSEQTAHFLQVNGAKTIAIVGSMTWNFVFYHLVVFKDSSKTSAEPSQLP